MPIFIVTHSMSKSSDEAAIAAHAEAVRLRTSSDAHFFRFWLNETTGRIFCMCEAASGEAALQAHRAGQDVTDERVAPVTPELAEMFLEPYFSGADGPVLPATGEIKNEPATRTILFTDIVDSTDMTRRLGDEAAMALIAVHDEIVRSAIAAKTGREVKHTGDGIMAVFVLAGSAINCATRIIRDVERYAGTHAEEPLRIRIGIAAGEPIGRASDLFGATVQLAARLCAAAQPNQILVSAAVASLCADKRLSFVDVGTKSLKGFDGDVPVLAVAPMMPLAPSGRIVAPDGGALYRDMAK